MSSQVQPVVRIHRSFFEARVERSEARARELLDVFYAGTRDSNVTVELERLEALINADLEVLNGLGPPAN